MNTIRCILLMVCVALVSLHAYAEEVEDPIQDFFDQHKRDGIVPPNATPEEVLRAKQYSGGVLMFRVDLNGDGKDEVFLSHENNLNARLGNIWDVYISKGNKYLRRESDNVLSLNQDTFVLKKCAATGRYRLFSVTSSGGKTDPEQLKVYEIVASEGSVTERMVAGIELSADKDGAIDGNADVMIDLLKDSSHELVIVRGGLEDLKKAMKKPSHIDKAEYKQKPVSSEKSVQPEKPESKPPERVKK